MTFWSPRGFCGPPLVVLVIRDRHEAAKVHPMTSIFSSSRDERSGGGSRRPPAGGPAAEVEVVTLDDDWDSLETLASNLLGR